MRVAPSEFLGMECRFKMAEAAASITFFPSSGCPPACDAKPLNETSIFEEARKPLFEAMKWLKGTFNPIWEAMK